MGMTALAWLTLGYKFLTPSEMRTVGAMLKVTTVSLYPEVKRPKWLRKGVVVECWGEGRGVPFTVGRVEPKTYSVVLINAEGRIHGRESWTKIYLPGQGSLP